MNIYMRLWSRMPDCSFGVLIPIFSPRAIIIIMQLTKWEDCSSTHVKVVCFFQSNLSELIEQKISGIFIHTRNIVHVSKYWIGLVAMALHGNSYSYANRVAYYRCLLPTAIWTENTEPSQIVSEIKFVNTRQTIHLFTCTGCLTKQLTRITWHNFVHFNAFHILFQI